MSPQVNNSQPNNNYQPATNWDNFGAANKNSNYTPPPVKPKTTNQPNRGRITGFSDLNNSTPKEEPKDKPQQWYTGGSKSGTMVEDAPNANNFYSSIQENSANREEKSQPKPPSSAFSGGGHRLGQTPGPSYQPPQNQPTQNQNKDRKSSEAHTIVITLYKNGFVVDDGPLRKYEDPANRQFLEDIKQGRAPPEFEQYAGAQGLAVDVVKKEGEDYKEPPPVFQAFTGGGQKLESSTTTSAVSGSGRPVSKVVNLNENEPVTTIQIWMVDGTKFTHKFNHSQTVGDIRQVIDNKVISEGKQAVRYRLQTNFPVQILADETTIKSAGLLNAVVVQKTL
eukprot:TRINITY_DN23047_c0_g1_i1.p1 TRINITY_DN23047_c0_g1~~TRINITY_DN23047_c0_g1_i1.p1  ORF type:complete len:392 (-),score=131.23 TRINITY_DN23047_c0_g1_i1:37-1047(-)